MLGIVFVLMYGMSLASISQKLMSIPTIFFIGITGTVGQELKNMYSFQQCGQHSSSHLLCPETAQLTL